MLPGEVVQKRTRELLALSGENPGEHPDIYVQMLYAMYCLVYTLVNSGSTLLGTIHFFIPDHYV